MGYLLLSAVVVVAALLLLYVLAVVLIVVRIAAPARSSLVDTPASMGLEYEDVSFRSRPDNLGIRGWYIPGGDRGTVIAVHGGKDNRSDALPFAVACNLAKRGFNVLTFDRRDCGESDRSRRLDRWHVERDVAGAYDMVRARSGLDESIFLYGTSMGALAAVAFASSGADIDGIVLDSCFADTPGAIKKAVSARAPLLSFLIPGMVIAAKAIYGVHKANAKDVITSVSTRILFIQGTNDDSVHLGDARELDRISKNPGNEVWIIDGAEHSAGYSFNPGLYMEKIVDFLTPSRELS